jgi:streptomycin 6-kinase
MKTRVDEPSDLISTTAFKWGLVLCGALPGASCSEVWSGHDADGNEVVLKIPEAHAEESGSIETLLRFSKCGGVPILRHDPHTGAILMPRLRPGSVLSDAGLVDDDAIRICAELTVGLRKAPRCDGISLETWFRTFLNEGPEDPVRVCRRLIETTSRWTILHGDLHHGNILLSDESWVVIDPKGIWGDPAFEPCSFIRNPIDIIATWSDPVSTTRHRVERFAHLLNEPPERVWGWAFVQTSECGYRSSGRWLEAMKVVCDALIEIGAPYRKKLGCP